MRYVVVLALALAIVPTARAQPTSAYYGLALGSFDYQEGDGFGNELIADTTDSYRLMVGYQFTEHLAVEGGWGKTEDITGSATFDVPPVGPVTFNLSTEFEILTVRLVGVLPFDNGITLLAGVGYADMTQEFSVDAGSLGQASDEEDVGEMTYFAGAQYDWERVAIRLAYEGYDFGGEVDVSEVSLAFFYKL